MEFWIFWQWTPELHVKINLLHHPSNLSWRNLSCWKSAWAGLERAAEIILWTKGRVVKEENIIERNYAFPSIK